MFGTGNKISKLDTGIVTSYALYIVLGIISLIFLVFFPVIFDITNSSASGDIFILELRLFIIYLASIILYFIL